MTGAVSQLIAGSSPSYHFHGFFNWHVPCFEKKHWLALHSRRCLVATIPVILAPIDGSEQSMNTIAYLGRTLSSKNVTIELFHVLAETPEPFFDLGETQETAAFETVIDKWKNSRSSQIDRFMEEARQTLVFNGFASSSISATVQPRREGIARDIVNRSENGYAAVVIGRKGFGTLPDYILGSVAAKLADTIDHLPLAIVGSQPNARKAIVAFDRSRGIRRGLEKVSLFLSPKLEEILLCHIVRPLAEPHPAHQSFFNSRNEASWLDENSRKIVPAMVEAKQCLNRAGFDPQSFHTVIIKEKTSRADGLMTEIEALKAGTIIIGRRGTTSVEKFTMGRVTRKILYLAYDKAIWIV
jgi:nucleotide-binding universal stress UspA family protein